MSQERLRTIEEALGPRNVECPSCTAGWVCENHPDRSWPDVCSCGAGMPCRCRPGART